jgi:simple sugar transport system permease protein
MRRLSPFLALFIGLCLGLGICALAGENPINIFTILVKSSFGSSYDLGMTLFYATPLILTGLAVAIPFQAGLFNIGAEGQLAMGALFAVTSALVFPNLAWPLAPFVATGAAFLGGALWGAIPGYLKAKRGSHEVIVTIMLNFIAAGLVSWVVLYLIKNPETQNPESLAVGSQFMLKHLESFGKAPVSTALFYVIGVAILLSLVISRTVFGFELRAVGKSEAASSFAGIEVDRMKILAMILGGGLAGLVGMVEILGHEGKLRLGFSQGAGFIGIAVALLARGKPLAIIMASLLFGALQKGAIDLELETTKITRDLSMVIQGLIILSMAAFNKVNNGKQP